MGGEDGGRRNTKAIISNTKIGKYPADFSNHVSNLLVLRRRHVSWPSGDWGRRNTKATISDTKIGNYAVDFSNHVPTSWFYVEGMCFGQDGVGG